MTTDDNGVVVAVATVGDSSAFSRNEVGRRSLRTAVTATAGIAEGLLVFRVSLSAAAMAAAAASSKTIRALKPVLAEVLQPSKPNLSSNPLVSVTI